MQSYYYLASPYSHPSPIIRELRFLAVEQATHHLMKKSQVVFSPILYTHALSIKNKMPYHANFWSDFNFIMLGASSGMKVLMLPGWDQSQGIGKERGWCQQLKKSLNYLYPSDAGVDEIASALRKLAA